MKKVRRVTVQLDAVQAMWLDALMDLNECSAADVMREALQWHSAREAVRVERTRYYEAIGLVARSAKWDPVSDYIAGREVVPP
jgi:hypothetical protein